MTWQDCFPFLVSGHYKIIDYSFDESHFLIHFRTRGV